MKKEQKETLVIPSYVGQKKRKEKKKVFGSKFVSRIFFNNQLHMYNLKQASTTQRWKNT